MSYVSLCADVINYPISATYDIDVESHIRLKKNNQSQTHAIREALQGSFTLIQGPPGVYKKPYMLIDSGLSTCAVIEWIHTV